MREQFPVPPSRGDFNEKVWEIVRQIPQGRVATYGQIAGMIPTPEGMDAAEYKAFRARWVGSAMAACPADVPWQRVINAQGKVSPRGPGAQHQRVLLEGEGVSFDDHGRIDLARHGWTGPSEQWLDEHGLVNTARDSQERLL
jgi:methylated-DNA-protein-cysteine methyltransferase-like protein